MGWNHRLSSHSEQSNGTKSAAKLRQLTYLVVQLIGKSPCGIPFAVCAVCGMRKGIFVTLEAVDLDGFGSGGSVRNILLGGEGNHNLRAVVQAGSLGASRLFGDSGNDRLQVVGGDGNLLQGRRAYLCRRRGRRLLRDLGHRSRQIVDAAGFGLA